MTVKRYTGWEMFPLEASHRNDGDVYIRATDYDELKRLYDDAIEKFVQLRAKCKADNGTKGQR